MCMACMQAMGIENGFCNHGVIFVFGRERTINLGRRHAHPRTREKIEHFHGGCVCACNKKFEDGCGFDILSFMRHDDHTPPLSPFFSPLHIPFPIG